MINIINVKEPINDANILRERAWNKDIEDPIKNVVSIIEEIKKGADVDLLKSIEKFDNVKLESFIVTKEEIKEAYENVTVCSNRIYKIHERETRENRADHNKQSWKY